MSISARPKEGFAASLSPEYPLLGLLARQPAHGYELHQKLSSDLGQVWHLSLSQVYNILNRLESHELIAGEVEEQEKLPARRLYHLTPAGLARFEAWLNTPSRISSRAIRVEFITRLYFAQLSGGPIIDHLIGAQIDEVRQGINRLQKMLILWPSEDLYNRLGMEFRINQLNAILEWLEQCRSKFFRWSDQGNCT